MMEFTLVIVAVSAVVATNWSAVSRFRMGLSGLLSFALGLRIAAVVTATYLLPCLTTPLFAQQAIDSPDENPNLEASTGELATAAASKGNENTTSAAAGEDHAVHPGSTKAVSSASAERRPESGADKLARPPVPIITNVSYLTENRPSWIEAGPQIEGELYKVSVRAGPYRTLRDCQPDLEREIQLAVEDFTRDHLRQPHAPMLISYTMNDLRRRNVLQEQFSEQLETSLGLMNQVHARLVFDNEFRDELDRRWAEIRSKSRLAQTGLGTGIVLLFLGTLFSFLKLDTATKGYYTGRLQFGAAATILALVAASVLLMKWIPWM
jgi:hypothetical protein